MGVICREGLEILRVQQCRFQQDADAREDIVSGIGTARSAIGARAPARQHSTGGRVLYLQHRRVALEQWDVNGSGVSRAVISNAQVASRMASRILGRIERSTLCKVDDEVPASCGRVSNASRGLRLQPDDGRLSAKQNALELQERFECSR